MWTGPATLNGQALRHRAARSFRLNFDSRSVTVALVVAVVVLSACDDGDNSGTGSESNSELSRPTTRGDSPSPGEPDLGTAGASPAETTGPLDFVFLARDTFQQRYDEAWAAWTTECAQSIGIDYVAPVLPRPTGVGGISQFGLEDANRAAEYGYLIEGDDGLGEVGDPANALGPAERELLDLALLGTPDSQVRVPVTLPTGTEVGSYLESDGCLSDFRHSFFGSAEEYAEFKEADMLLQTVVGESRSELLASDDFRNLNSEWATCMSSAGFSEFSHPLEPFDVDWDSDRPSAQERSVAEADVRCKEEILYLKRAGALIQTIQWNLIERYSLETHIAVLIDIFDARPGGVDDETQ